METLQSFGLGNASFDIFGVQHFEVGKDYELTKVGSVSDVAPFVWVAIPPFFGGHAEECNIDNIGFAGVGSIDIAGGEVFRDDVFLDSVCMYAVVCFGYFPAC